MAILDKENMFCNDLAVTTTGQIGDVIDLGALGIGKGNVDNVFIEVWVTEAFTADGAATLTIAVQTDDAAAFSSAVTKQTTQAIGKATLAAGYRIPLGTILQGTEQYIRLYGTVATGPMTAGALSAGLVLDRDTNIGS